MYFISSISDVIKLALYQSIRWEFKTDHHNIAFGVIKVIENDDGTVEYYEVVIPIDYKSYLYSKSKRSYLSLILR